MTNDNKPADRSPVVKYVAAATVSALFLALGAFAISQRSGDFDLNLGSEGINIKVNKSDDFAAIIEKSIGSEDARTRRTARTALLQEGFVDVASAQDDVLASGLLRQHNYFHISDAALARALATHDFTNDAELRRLYLDMLWRRKGPFGVRALAGAPPDFLTAFEELHTDLGRENAASSPLLEAMWVRSIEWQPPFERLKFRAAVEVLPDSPETARTMFICKGAEHLAGKYVRLSIADPEDPSRRAFGTGTVERKARVDEDILPCDGGASVGEMLRGQRVRFGISQALAKQILHPSDDTTSLPSQFTAQFVVRPRYLVSESEVAMR